MLQGRQTIMTVCLLGEVFDFHNYTVSTCSLYVHSHVHLHVWLLLGFYVYLYVTRGMWDCSVAHSYNNYYFIFRKSHSCILAYLPLLPGYCICSGN